MKIQPEIKKFELYSRRNLICYLMFVAIGHNMSVHVTCFTFKSCEIFVNIRIIIIMMIMYIMMMMMIIII